MDPKEHEDLIRAYDAGQPKAVRVTFEVTIEMTDQQRDSYVTLTAFAERYGVGFVGMEVGARARQDVARALDEAEWLRGFGTVKISRPKEA